MSKAILVLDEMPDDCDECPLCRYDECRCMSCGATCYHSQDIERMNGQKKPDWCPLRPMPEKVYYGRDCSEWDDGYQTGVAATLRAIEGSGEE